MFANPTLKTVKMKNNQFELHAKDEKTDKYREKTVIMEDAPE